MADSLGEEVTPLSVAPQEVGCALRLSGCPKYCRDPIGRGGRPRSAAGRIFAEIRKPGNPVPIVSGLLPPPELKVPRSNRGGRTITVATRFRFAPRVR